MPFPRILVMLILVLSSMPGKVLSAARAADEFGVPGSGSSGGRNQRLSIEYAHYRPARWEQEQVVERERDFPNRGGLLYLYVRNTSDRKLDLRYWRLNGKDETVWLQGNQISWFRLLDRRLDPGRMTVLEINGISPDFAEGLPYRFEFIDDTWRPAVRHEGMLVDDPLDISFIRVFPEMDELELHLRYTGRTPIRLTDVRCEGVSIEEVRWKGRQLSGAGRAIARVRLAEPVAPATQLMMSVGYQSENDGSAEPSSEARVYAHRRAFPDSFPVGTWGLNQSDYEFLKQSGIDTGVRSGTRSDDFYGGNAQKYGLRSLVDVEGFPWNVDRLRDLSGHPAVFAWMLGDELDNRLHPLQVLSIDNAVRKLDSTKPVLTTLCRNVKFMEYAPIVDIACMDHYCVTAPTSAVWEHRYGGRLEETGFYTKDLKYAAEPKATVVWSQGIHEWSERPKRGVPTSEELSVQLIQNLGRGAKGILWFTWQKRVAEMYPRLFETAVGWTRVMQDLKDVLLSSEPAELCQVSEEHVDAAALLSWDRILVCVSNLDYDINDEAYVFRDRQDVEIQIQMPDWIRGDSVQRVTGAGNEDVRFRRAGDSLMVTLPSLHDVALLSITDSDAP